VSKGGKFLIVVALVLLGLVGWGVYQGEYTVAALTLLIAIDCWAAAVVGRRAVAR
jgi:hypothetical protein